MTSIYFNRLAYDEMGKENSEIILFLHSKLLGKWIWERQSEGHNQYFNDFHCIFLDLPNHGESKAYEKFSIKSSAEEIMDFIRWLIEMKGNDEKGIKGINLVSMGIGSSIAIEIICKNPELVDTLIISGPEIADFKEKESESVVNRLAKTQAEYLNEKPDKFIVKAYLRYYGISKDYYSQMESVLSLPIKDEKRIAFESLNYSIPDDLANNEELMKKENILIAYGNKEDLNCTESAIRLKSIFKNAKLIEIDKGNHLWNIIDYDLFNRAISHFIKSGTIEKNTRIRNLQ